MRYKPGQRVAFYEVTGISDPSPAKNLEVGEILIDGLRGKHTQWDFINLDSSTPDGWITGKLLGYARVDPKTLKPIPEPKLQAILGAKKEARDAQAD